jgi:hypothetical protein
VGIIGHIHQSVRLRAEKAVTAGIPGSRLRRLMRARKFKSQSKLINTLLEEEEERPRSHQMKEVDSGSIAACLPFDSL